MSRVLVAGTFDPEFARNQRLIGFLEANGHEVVTCHATLWRGPRYQMPGRRLLPTAFAAVFAYVRLVYTFLRTRRADVVLVLYPGWFDVIVLGPLAWLRRMPVLFDPFISLSDTVVSDRELVTTDSWLASLLVFIDRASLRIASRVIADTPTDAAFYAELAEISRRRIGVVWVGADDAHFGPRLDVVPIPGRVLFYGSFIKLHGIDVIVRAAKLLESDDVQFRIIGTGQEDERISTLLRELAPGNVERIQHVPIEFLADEIAAATICLGIFGSSEKAQRVVPNKVFECAAVGRPIITGDTRGIRSAFAVDDLALVPSGDPAALAAEIRDLLADPERRERLALAAHRRYETHFASAILRAAINAEIEATLA